MKGALHELRELLIPRRQTRAQILRNCLITAVTIVVCTALCAMLSGLGESDNAVQMIYVLGVLVTARLTDGFIYSLFAAVVSVVGGNFAFTYPYFELNFTITGYPLTFVTLFMVLVVVGMLTGQVKRQGRAQAEAEKEKMKANLLRSVSHDLRTPLTAIIGSSTAVLENYDAFSDDVKKDLISHVRDDAQWLMRLVENILSITRISGGDVRIVKQEEAAEEVAAQAVKKFRTRAGDVKVSVHVPDELLLVPMDAVLIEQVMLNLMDNALQHAKSATHIDLRISRRGSDAVFCVEDDGAGIDEAILPKLFEEMFPHAQEMSGDGRRNMGIGLSVCKSIVDAHGGTMRACNRPQGGASVSFTLPMKEETQWQSKEK